MPHSVPPPSDNQHPDHCSQSLPVTAKEARKEWRDANFCSLNEKNIVTEAKRRRVVERELPDGEIATDRLLLPGE